MQLTKTTDYAIRCVMYLSGKDSPVTLKELGKAISVSPAYISITICKLINVGIVKSSKGQYGGYELAKAEKEITLYDIIAAMEKTMYVNTCLEDSHQCSNGTINYCNVHRYYLKVQDCLDNILKEVTLDQLVNGNF